MANEITTTIQLSVSNGNYVPGQISYTKQIDQAAQGAHGGIQVVGTTEEALGEGDVTAEGILFLRNLDSTNFVIYGSTNFEFKLKAGEFSLQRMNTSKTVTMKADTASVKVQVLLLEN